MKKEGLVIPESDPVNEVVRFLSDITGLPVTRVSAFPELQEVTSKPLHGEIPYKFRIVLEQDGDKYEIQIDITFSNEWSSEWLSVTSWSVTYNNEEIFQAGDSVNTTNSFWEEDLCNVGKVKDHLLKETRDIVGGLFDTQFGFTDFETCTLGGLQNEDSYIRNIYLVLMTHMKQIGMAMPPILTKRPEIAKAMKFGDIDALDRITKAINLFEMPDCDRRCQAHILREIEVIRERTNWEKNKRDPMVTLSETFPGLEIEVIEKGKPVYPPSNILVIENDLNVFGEFSDKVQDALRRDGRYKGTKVIRQFNLPFCIDLVRTGKIDLIIFDWSKPSNWEVLMLSGKSNPLFFLTQGDIQGIMELDGAKLEIGLPDGSVVGPEDLREKAQKADIRSRWMETIASACIEDGLAAPPYFIVRNNFELGQIDKIISQKLGHPIK